MQNLTCRLSVPFDETMSVLDVICLYHDQDKDLHTDGLVVWRSAALRIMVDGVPKLACKSFRDWTPNYRSRLSPNRERFDCRHDAVHRAPRSDRVLTSLVTIVSLKTALTYKHLEQNGEVQTVAGCINCGLCYAASSIWSEPWVHHRLCTDSLAHRYNLDSRDNVKMSVWSHRIGGKWRLGLHVCWLLSEVRPKKVDPAAAVNQVKLSLQWTSLSRCSSQMALVKTSWGGIRRAIVSLMFVRWRERGGATIRSVPLSTCYVKQLYRLWFCSRYSQLLVWVR